MKSVLTLNIPDTAKVTSMFLITMELHNRNIQEALMYANRMLKISDSIGFIAGKAMTYRAFGNINLNTANYKQALFYYLLSLRLYESLGDKKEMSIMYNNIGNTYFRSGNNKKANGYYMKALDQMLKLGMYKESNMAYINLGVVSETPEQAIFYFKKGWEMSRKNNDEHSESSSLMNLAEIYFTIGKLDSAKLYFEQALPLTLKIDNHYHIQNCYLMLGKVAINENNFKQAEKYLLFAEQMSKDDGIRELLPNIYEALFELYLKRNDLKKALTYNQQFHTLKDSTFNENTHRQLIEMQAAYDIEKKDKQIQLLNKDKEIVETRIHRERLMRNSLIVTVILILVVCIIIVRNMRLKQKVNQILNNKNKQIELQKQEIERKNNELKQANNQLSKYNNELINENISAKYEVLKSKTNPHFLFNSLTTLSSIVVEDQNLAVKYIERFSELYRMILERSDRKLISLEDEMEVVNHYLYLQNVRYDNDLLIDIAIQSKASQYMVPPFAVQLVVENAIKHNMISEDWKLRISIKTQEQYLIISNSLQKRYVKAVSTGTGQKNIIERYKLMSDIQPIFMETPTEYVVKLPLLENYEAGVLNI